MNRYSYLSHLECARCGLVHDATIHQGLCTKCRSPLLARYDLSALAEEMSREELRERPWELWRYHELLPSSSASDQLTLGEVVTPLLKLERYGRSIGLQNLYVKDESATPTSTFKARGAAVGVSRVKELGVERIAMPTNGNAGAAWASYAARGQVSSLIVMPADAPAITRAECLNAGAQLYLVDGVISDAGAIVADAAASGGWVDVGTLKEPYRIEGKKTMGFEIVEQLGWELPEVIVYPTGGGVGLIGIHKAISEMQALGWVTGTMPRFVAVQSTGCAPIVSAFEAGRAESAFWPGSQTVAFGINVPKPLGDFIVLDVLYRSGGCAVAVSDEDLLVELRTVGADEGLFMCPEGATAAVAVRRLATEGWIKPTDRVVILNTGAGIKYPELVDVDLPVMHADERVALPESADAGTPQVMTVNRPPPRALDVDLATPDPIPEEAIDDVVQIMRSGAIFRYAEGGSTDSAGESARGRIRSFHRSAIRRRRQLLRRRRCTWLCTASGVGIGDVVLMNSWTLAPGAGCCCACRCAFGAGGDERRT